VPTNVSNTGLAKHTSDLPYHAVDVDDGQDHGLGGRLLRQRPSGVLDLEAGRRWFSEAQLRTAPELSQLIEHYWRVRWDVRGHGPHTQHTLSNASVHLVVQRGECRIQGVVTGRFTKVLEGEGRVFGVKFRPAGFRPFRGSRVSDLTDRSIPIREVFGAEGDALAEEILSLDDEARIVELLDAFFLERLPPVDPLVPTLNGIVARIVEDRTVTTVDRVVGLTGIGKRTLQRLFSQYVGVSPKWVIQRYRLHEAEERLAAGQPVDLATLALELGYYDQAHFARDFRAIVGRPPSSYGRSAAG
jgi:AraC-like DNA-binding protein